ncbi:hypothetical protein BJ138DRAFT_1120421, partial [Hygrophoropsis aurantiaca]
MQTRARNKHAHPGLIDRANPRWSTEEVQQAATKKTAAKTKAAKDKQDSIRAVATIENQIQQEEDQEDAEAAHPPPSKITKKRRLSGDQVSRLKRLKLASSQTDENPDPTSDEDQANENEDVEMIQDEQPDERTSHGRQKAKPPSLRSTISIQRRELLSQRAASEASTGEQANSGSHRKLTPQTQLLDSLEEYSGTIPGWNENVADSTPNYGEKVDTPSIRSFRTVSVAQSKNSIFAPLSDDEQTLTNGARKNKKYSTFDYGGLDDEDEGDNGVVEEAEGDSMIAITKGQLKQLLSSKRRHVFDVNTLLTRPAQHSNAMEQDHGPQEEDRANKMSDAQLPSQGPAHNSRRPIDHTPNPQSTVSERGSNVGPCPVPSAVSSKHGRIPSNHGGSAASERHGSHATHHRSHSVSLGHQRNDGAPSRHRHDDGSSSRHRRDDSGSSGHQRDDDAAPGHRHNSSAAPGPHRDNSTTPGNRRNGGVASRPPRTGNAPTKGIGQPMARVHACVRNAQQELSDDKNDTNSIATHPKGPRKKIPPSNDDLPPGTFKIWRSFLVPKWLEYVGTLDEVWDLGNLLPMAQHLWNKAFPDCPQTITKDGKIYAL